MHICRGNWSKREEVLVSGDYRPLVDCLQATRVDQLVLEFATPRAGELSVVGDRLSHKELGLGCVNPRTDVVESANSIVNRAREAVTYWSPDRVFLNPDCGFGCFATRCVNDESTATAKLKSIAEAAKILRAEFA